MYGMNLLVENVNHIDKMLFCEIVNRRWFCFKNE